MLIALCLFKYFPYGGLQRDFMAIGKELHKRGHKIRVYTRTWQGERPDEFEIIQTPVKALTNQGLDKKYYLQVMSHLRSHPVDIIVGFNKMPGLDVYYAADVCYAEKVEKENRNFIYKLTPRYFHNINFEKSIFQTNKKTEILLLTKKQKEEFQKHYHTEDNRLHLLPPGISTKFKKNNLPQNAKSEIYKILNIKPGSLLCLQIGSDFIRKGVDRSILALSSLPKDIKKQVHLIIIGQDNSNKLINLAKKNNVDHLVHFLYGRNDIPTFIAGCDLFLHPARSESAGIAILESLVGGLPEIVTEVCGYSTYVRQASSGIILASPFDQLAYNKILAHAIVDTKQRLLWSANATQWSNVNDIYSLHKKAADIILSH